MKLAEMTWREVADLAKEEIVAVVPVASCEQHSYHLPFFTDSLLITAIVERVEEEMRDDILLLPTQWLGVSQHHIAFGAITVSERVHMDMLVSIINSLLSMGFRKVLVVNGHGGNRNSVRCAIREVYQQHPDCLLAAADYWDVAMNVIAKLLEGPRRSIGHSDEIETSLMLSLYPKLVRKDAIDDDDFAPPPALKAVYLPVD
ncbi:MAG TPA: creatininase family protein, partial [Armatimonadetes bacterium]|nr:creatininase family protein [Armatimonadota bacterium]